MHVQAVADCTRECVTVRGGGAAHPTDEALAVEQPILQVKIFGNVSCVRAVLFVESRRAKQRVDRSFHCLDKRSRLAFQAFSLSSDDRICVDRPADVVDELWAERRTERSVKPSLEMLIHVSCLLKQRPG